MPLVLTGCSGAGGGGGGGGGHTINVLMVNNPQMVDLQKLTADNFTKQTGITVNYTVLPENDVRDKISQEKIATEVAAWEGKRNAREARIHWSFTLAVARQKLRKLYPSIED